MSQGLWSLVTMIASGLSGKKARGTLNNTYCIPISLVKGPLWYRAVLGQNGLGPLVTLTGCIDQDKYVDCLAKRFLLWYDKLHKDTDK